MQERQNRSDALGRIADLEISPLEYYKLVVNFNLLIQQELTEKLNQHRDYLGTTVTFVTPGSDGRLEKGSFLSPLEVIAITDTNLDLEEYKKSLIEIIDSVSPTTIAKIIEMKGPASSLVTAYNNRYQPGRIADSRLIFGSSKELTSIKEKLGREIINLKAGEVDKIANLKRDARKVVERGSNRIAGMDAIHFDLQSGVIFFNPDSYQLSFKVGPFRLVQNTLLLEEVRHTRRENDPDFIKNLEASIVSRLDQLSDDRMVEMTKSSIKEIQEHYAFFLRLYHRSEKAYEKDKKVAIQLTPQEIAEVSKRLQALLLLMEKFKIQRQPKQSVFPL